MLDSKLSSIKPEHKLELDLREKLSLTGVKEIMSFDEKNVNVKTNCGELSIDGDNIHINVLNVEKGELEIQGKINGINYFDVYESDKKNLLSRIFK